MTQTTSCIYLPLPASDQAGETRQKLIVSAVEQLFCQMLQQSLQTDFTITCHQLPPDGNALSATLVKIVNDNADKIAGIVEIVGESYHCDLLTDALCSFFQQFPTTATVVAESSIGIFTALEIDTPLRFEQQNHRKYGHGRIAFTLSPESSLVAPPVRQPHSTPAVGSVLLAVSKALHKRIPFLQSNAWSYGTLPDYPECFSLQLQRLCPTGNPAFFQTELLLCGRRKLTEEYMNAVCNLHTVLPLENDSIQLETGHIFIRSLHLKNDVEFVPETILGLPCLLTKIPLTVTIDPARSKTSDTSLPELTPPERPPLSWMPEQLEQSMAKALSEQLQLTWQQEICSGGFPVAPHPFSVAVELTGSRPLNHQQGNVFRFKITVLHSDRNRALELWAKVDNLFPRYNWQIDPAGKMPPVGAALKTGADFQLENSRGMHCWRGEGFLELYFL